MGLARGRWDGLGWLLVFYLANTYLVVGLQQNEIKSRKSVKDASSSTEWPTLGEASPTNHHETSASASASASHHGGGGDDSGERHNVGLCCGRHQKFVAIGFGVSGEVVQLDVGHCRKSCKKAHMEAPGHESSVPMEPLTHQPCPAMHSCSPSESHLQRVSTLHGVQQMEVVDTCECREKPSHCKRQSHQVLVNPGTPYETRIDVGTCAGGCSLAGTGCRALRNQTLSVPGPNGDQCHSVVAECGCLTSCYRASFREAVFDYTEGEHNSTSFPAIKEIDVGVCVGSCAGDATRKCVFRDRVDPSRCLAGLYSGRRSECAPAQFAVHRYLTKQQEAREIIAITECRCA